MHKKITTTTTEEYSDYPYSENNSNSNSAHSYIRVDAPLMLRLLEYAKEDASNDLNLHHLTTNMVEMSQNGRVLTAYDYENIIETSVTPVVGTHATP